MLASVSSSQLVIPGDATPRQSSVNNKNNTESKDNKNTLESESSKYTKKAANELTKEELAQVQQLKQRDLEVKAHEQAHASTAGALAIGGATFTFATGPNGVRYAVSGEVNIDTSPIAGDPAATIRKADAIRRAALAPASPSSQDQSVASRATGMAETARTELIQQTQEDQKIKKESKVTDETEEDLQKNNNKIDETSNKPDSLIGSLVDFSV
jgi:hypothetical protein